MREKANDHCGKCEICHRGLRKKEAKPAHFHVMSGDENDIISHHQFPSSFLLVFCSFGEKESHYFIVAHPL